MALISVKLHLLFSNFFLEKNVESGHFVSSFEEKLLMKKFWLFMPPVSVLCRVSQGRQWADGRKLKLFLFSAHP